MATRKTKSAQSKAEWSFRGILASVMLAAFAVWLFLSIIGSPPASAELTRINRFGGPAGAFAASVLVGSFGYLSVFIPILLLILTAAKLFEIRLRKTLVLSGEVVSAHAILAGLLGLPGSGLSFDIVGKYGLALSHSMKSAFGGFGAYLFAVALFLGFVATIARLDIRSSFSAARGGITGARAWLTARRERRDARKDASREEVFAKYSTRVKESHAIGGITGSLIPGDLSKVAEPAPAEKIIALERERPEPEPIKYMEYIPPPIKRTIAVPKRGAEIKPAKAESTPPPPPVGHLDTIDPRVLKKTEEPRSIPKIETPFIDAEFDTLPIIGHEPPMPEPLVSDEPLKMTSIYDTRIPEPRRESPAPSVHFEPTTPIGPYKYSPPPINILIDPEPDNEGVSDTALHQQSQRLLETLKSFNVEGEIREICPGPVITRFELEPAVGVKVSRIANLADDIALALKAQDIRIVAPIPGKGAVGIEVPNEYIQTVRIKSEIASDDFKSKKHSLPLALGKRVDGTPAVADLTKMPHLLIAGSTGSGKSVCINSIITSLVYSKSPKEVRLVLIDPKRLELSVYKGIPHLAAPIVVEPKHASIALNWATEEMDSRYKLLSQVGVRSIADYNDYIDAHKEREDLEKLPYIVVVVDELADLMVMVASEIEEPIARLAQMARAVGIHLIIATQRPSVDVITGLIKANFPSRIAFKVRSKIDSRTILDMGGAERLLGRGDMLYLPSGYADAIRIHGCLITTEETERIVRYLSTFPNPYPTMIDLDEQEAINASQVDQDELFWEAAKIVVMYQQGSTSFLQRKLRIGYTRAGCIIDQLEMSGIVGPFQGSKAREVLVKDLDSIDEMRQSGVSS